MDTAGLVDNRNLELWNSLRSVREIEIRKERRTDYLVFSEGNRSVISVPIDNLNSASFTHELLHIYLRTKDVFIGGGIKASIRGNQKLSRIFSDDLLDHIGNCLDHIKMLPEFLKLGYRESDFMSDYSTNKLTRDEISKIKNYFTTSTLLGKVYNISAVDAYIGRYFAANSCSNKSFDYNYQLSELKNIDPELFHVLNTFFTAWKEFDYNDHSPFAESYRTFLYDFTESLEKWIERKSMR